MKIQYEDMKSVFSRILLSRGLANEDAEALAKIFADNSLDGIYSHGVNRFPRLISYLDNGRIALSAQATVDYQFGAFERWNGHRGLGPLNACRAMDRACDLAEKFGIGIVALGNNNHWMRGGSYGWQAAEKGFIGICWSNTMPNMPVWGGMDRKIGNNPIVMAIPIEDGHHLVVDCALSQFSYGKLEEYKLNGSRLPVVGGYDSQGKLSTDPAEIEKTWRVLPMGYWKGSGLSVALDAITSILTMANSVHEIGAFGEEVGLSQVFIAIHGAQFSSSDTNSAVVSSIISDIKSSVLDPDFSSIRYPGEREFNTRQKNLREGIPIVEEVWNQILEYTR